jgi:hypothetical protein
MLTVTVLLPLLQASRCYLSSASIGLNSYFGVQV